LLWPYRLEKFHLPNRGEQKSRARTFGVSGGSGDSGGLRERFGQDHPGNNRIIREMAGKNGIVLCKMRFAFRRNPRLTRSQLFDKNERGPMRKAGEELGGQRSVIR